MTVLSTFFEFSLNFLSNDIKNTTKTTIFRFLFEKRHIRENFTYLKRILSQFS